MKDSCPTVLGLDSIELGAALGVACEAGFMEYGDGDRALEIIEEVGQGTLLGRILGNGTAVTGEVFGVERVPIVKRQAMSAYDPRAIKGTGVTYATSPQGADHTCGLTIRAKLNTPIPKVKQNYQKALKTIWQDTTLSEPVFLQALALLLPRNLGCFSKCQIWH